MGLTFYKEVLVKSFVAVALIGYNAFVSITFQLISIASGVNFDLPSLVS